MSYASIVVPAFNAAATLPETLRSLSAQSFGDFEIIVVDDGSTDATAEIAQAHASTDRGCGSCSSTTAASPARATPASPMPAAR